MGRPNPKSVKATGKSNDGRRFELSLASRFEMFRPSSSWLGFASGRRLAS